VVAALSARRTIISAQGNVVASMPTVRVPTQWRTPFRAATALDVFVGYLMLDAWIGNQDRHHRNWGVIFNPVTYLYYLAPTFDHASSLGRNESDTKRLQRLNELRPGHGMRAFVERARSAFFESPQSDKAMLTLDAFFFAARQRAAAAEYWTQRLSAISAD